MIKEFLSIISGLFEGLDIRRRWLIIIATLALLLLALFGYEYTTGYNYYSALDKKIRLLTELHKLRRNGLADDQDLYPVYKQIIDELAARRVSPVLLPSPGFPDPVIALKFAGGAFLWVIVAILGLYGTFGEQNKIVGAVAFLVIGIILGIVGTFIPTILNPWVNAIGFPIAQLVVITTYGGRTKKT